MTVAQLRKVYKAYAEVCADSFRKKLDRQRLGVRLSQIYNQQDNVIDIILIENLVKANDQLLESDHIRYPVWCDKDTFKKFISKITSYAGNNLS